MDKKILNKKLKKYLFFISVVFLSLTSIHLIYSYIYFDSKEVPQKGGTISESFVGKFPELNPLKYNNDQNKYINHILYRSLLNYDIYNNKITGDLATCNIENTSDIKCDLKPNIKWSNGDDITTEDIVQTYKTIKEKNTNPVIKSILDNIKISSTDNSILFKSNIKDVNILNILFQPILAKKVIEKIEEDNLTKALSPIDGIYSGKYIISKIDQDETTGIKRLFLEKNPFYIKNPTYIKNIILKIYKDFPSLLQQRDNINIFNDKTNIIGDSIPKLKNNKYILNQYIGVFINRDKIEYPNIRNFILSTINSEEIVKEIGDKNNKIIKSPFLNNLNLDINKPKTSLKTMLNSLGYYKKEYYLSKLGNIKKETKLISNEAKLGTGETRTGTIKLEKDNKEVDITKIKNSITKENYNSKSKLIIEPNWVDKYNFITNPNITLKGISNKNVSEIYINDYKLKNYKPGDKNFYYKLSPSLDNIKQGENNYKIYFVENGKKQLKDDITFFYNKNKKYLEKYETDLIAGLINKKIKEKKQELTNKENNEVKEDTKIEKSNNITKENLEKYNLIKALDDRFYYNKDYKAYSLNLNYINGSKEIAQTSEIAKKQLENSGIKINISPIKTKDLQKQLKENTEKYDIIISGINLGYFPSNIAKYFYSGQIEKGKNLSKIRGSKLDSTLEDLKSININNKEKLLELEKSVISTLQRENIFKPIYSPYYSNLVLKNIQGYNLPEIIPDNIYRFDPLVKSYILKEKIINNNGKSILGFLKYITDKLF